MNNATDTQPRSASSICTTPDSPAETSHGHDDVLVLHWVLAPDADMADQLGIEAPALCGDWGDADTDLADEVTSGRRMVRYESCKRCDEIKWGAGL